MTDMHNGIVERLRTGSAILKDHPGEWYDGVRVLTEAADLIETLNAALAEATEREAIWAKGRRPFQNQNEVIAGQVKRIDDLTVALAAAPWRRPMSIETARADLRTRLYIMGLRTSTGLERTLNAIEALVREVARTEASAGDEEATVRAWCLARDINPDGAAADGILTWQVIAKELRDNGPRAYKSIEKRDHVTEWKQTLAANLRGNWEAAAAVEQLIHAVLNARVCFECDTPLLGPICPKCNPPSTLEEKDNK